MDASELGGERELPSLEDAAVARERAGGELKYRASGGARGVAPMQRLMDERRAMGSQLAARVQRKADGGAAGNVAIPESGGSKLPDGVRTKMEPKLGADLSDVRVHTGGESAQAATGLGARAFTVGSDVHFNAGEFAPGSKEGDRLLAHELTHVVQGKKSGIQRKPDESAATEQRRARRRRTAAAKSRTRTSRRRKKPTQSQTASPTRSTLATRRAAPAARRTARRTGSSARKRMERAAVTLPVGNEPAVTRRLTSRNKAGATQEANTSPRSPHRSRQSSSGSVAR